MTQYHADDNSLWPKKTDKFGGYDISIIIPVFNDAEMLSQTLAALRNHAGDVETIVVDGGSTDGSVEAARNYTPLVVRSSKGRGVQQDAGARCAHGDILVFLHADTLLPSGFGHLICQAFADPEVVFGAFLLAIHPPTPILNGIAFAANLRSILFGLPYGDQALCVRRPIYLQVGGFRPWPIMEDVDLVRRLNRVGAFKMIRTPVKTSARRWEKENPVFTTLRNWSLIIRYLLGASPEALARHYLDAG